MPGGCTGWLAGWLACGCMVCMGGGALRMRTPAAPARAALQVGLPGGGGEYEVVDGELAACPPGATAVLLPAALHAALSLASQMCLRPPLMLRRVWVDQWRRPGPAAARLQLLM